MAWRRQKRRDTFIVSAAAKFERREV